VKCGLAVRRCRSHASLSPIEMWWVTDTAAAFAGEAPM
jgi:hypothetical protein